MKDLVLFFISLLIGIGAVFGYSIFKTQNISQKLDKEKKTPKSRFSIESPPSETLKGLIATRSGTLLWESRIATAPAKLENTVPIQQGERLLTETKSQATVNFDRVGSFELAENSDLSFIQTLPVNLVVEQKKGKIKYTVNGKTPLSIKIRSALIAKKSGIIEIALEDDDPIILLSTLQGTARIGFNDLDYHSQVFTLREGQIYEFNSDERTAINTGI
ncbi:hypothetical protein A3A74_02575 [Candidatus Roizmanbacteria bacterium RIFCSPLOWO2_01_FULL_35_13]|uniref:FecR protein domain-containing protein n=1 Tax=Candidatus Roizmanbacteria bacterium RIFCSPLOWO2_01_FULL_35_13 TaxID=1802055 RepID=A0A1F7IEV9_9BACT|nr:MAG: hypothetical protein A3A74_02575 [Candidatus Roizmanbacteria bacterium RIFCSPLOWO2_01_FULL_35_13]